MRRRQMLTDPAAWVGRQPRPAQPARRTAEQEAPKLPKAMDQNYEHYNVYRDGAVYSVLQLKGGRKYESKGIAYRPGCSDLGEQAVVSLVRNVVGGMMREREYMFEKAREQGNHVSPSKANMLFFLKQEMQRLRNVRMWVDLRPSMVHIAKYLSSLAPKPESSHYENWNTKVMFLSVLCLADAEYKGFTTPKPVEHRQMELF